jgi:hypothetical protein
MTPWVSFDFFSDVIVAEGAFFLDGAGSGSTGLITLPDDHYYDLLWTEDGVFVLWQPVYLSGCQVFFVEPPPGYVIPTPPPLPPPPPPQIPPKDGFGIVDPATGLWTLRNASDGSINIFYFGNPGDLPMIGDWDCDGDETPGLYRQADGFVYLRNSNTQGAADIRFFFGNPGDIPLAGDFDGDGCHTVSIYRPAEGRVYIINQLGANEGGLGPAEHSYFFGNPGDKPYVGDFNGDGMDTIGLHRESTGLVYFRQTHSQGNADSQFIFGDPGDKIMAAEWTADGIDKVGLFRPSDTTVYLRYSNSQGNADYIQPFGTAPGALPVAGKFEG